MRLLLKLIFILLLSQSCAFAQWNEKVDLTPTGAVANGVDTLVTGDAVYDAIALANSDYLLNNADDTTSGSLWAVNYYASGDVVVTDDIFSDQITAQAGNGSIIALPAAGAIIVKDDVGTGGYISFGANSASLGLSRDGTVDGYDYDGAFIFEQQGTDADEYGEFIWMEENGNWRFALPKSQAGMGTYNPRSMIIAGPSVNTRNNFIGTYWGFDKVDMATSTTGADLGVQDDVEINGTAWIDENLTVASTVWANGKMLISKDDLTPTGAVADGSTNLCTSDAIYDAIALVSGSSDTDWTESGNVVSTDDSVQINSNATISGRLTVDNEIHADAFYGDGSGLTGVAGSGDIEGVNVSGLLGGGGDSGTVTVSLGVIDLSSDSTVSGILATTHLPANVFLDADLTDANNKWIGATYPSLDTDSTDDFTWDYDYGDLINTPDAVLNDDLTNKVTKVATVGTWDTDVSDDFDGAYSSLTGTPYIPLVPFDISSDDTVTGILAETHIPDGTTTDPIDFTNASVTNLTVGNNLSLDGAVSPSGVAYFMLQDASGQYLGKSSVAYPTTDGASAPGGGFTQVTTQILTTGTGETYTPTSGATYFEIWVTGEGGGGGGSDGDGSSFGGAGGGGGGGTAYRVMTATEMGENAVYTVGSSGGGGGSGTDGTSGANGAASTFYAAGTGPDLTGSGGLGGTGTGVLSAGGAFPGGAGSGGTSSGGQVIYGNSGGCGTGSDNIFGASGTGGGSFFGGGAVGRSSNGAGISASDNTGAGGSGAVTIDTNTGSAGGNGGTGIIIIKEYK
jgi:hypothetical protein